MNTCPICGKKAWRVYGDGCERCISLHEDEADRNERIADERADAAVDELKNTTRNNE